MFARSLLLVVFSLGSVASLPVAFAGPTPVVVPFQRAYVPEGFDSNDVVEFVVESAFPSTCYRPGIAGAAVHRAGRRVEIVSTAFLYTGACYDVMVPFSQTITLGPLEAGTYEIVQPGSRGPLGRLVVAPARGSEPDDFLYAPISQALFQPRGAGGDLVLTGAFPASCLTLSEVRVAVEPTAIVVQPIARMDDSRTCVRGSFPFQKVVPLPPAPRGRYVLHVRSMNGNAVNSLIDIR